MKNVLVLGVAALALVGCAKKEEAAPAPAAESAAPATDTTVAEPTVNGKTAVGAEDPKDNAPQ